MKHELELDKLAIEFNPVVIEFQRLIIAEWRRHFGESDTAEPLVKEPTLA